MYTHTHTRCLSPTISASTHPLLEGCVPPFWPGCLLLHLQVSVKTPPPLVGLVWLSASWGFLQPLAPPVTGSCHSASSHLHLWVPSQTSGLWMGTQLMLCTTGSPRLWLMRWGRGTITKRRTQEEEQFCRGRWGTGFRKWNWSSHGLMEGDIQEAVGSRPEARERSAGILGITGWSPACRGEAGIRFEWHELSPSSSLAF